MRVFRTRRATCVPMRAPTVVANRRWMPPKTRASSTWWMASEKRAKRRSTLGEPAEVTVKAVRFPVVPLEHPGRGRADARMAGRVLLEGRRGQQRHPAAVRRGGAVAVGVG